MEPNSKPTPDFYQIIYKNIKPMGVVVTSLLIFALAWVGYSWIEEKKEKEIQAEYYQIEREYLKKKEAFEKAIAEEKAKSQEKGKAQAKKNEPQAIAQDPAALPSGDYEKDYGQQVESLKLLSKKASSRHGSMLSSILLSQIYLQHQKPDLAKDVLEQSLRASSNSLLHALQLNQLGTAHANLKNCALAIQVWDKILTEKKYAYLHKETQLRQGICYEYLKDYSNAEKKYLEASQKKTLAENSTEKMDMASFAGSSETEREAESRRKALKIRMNFEN
jgi:tetratricopeptide (TPR) repeat protein